MPPDFDHGRVLEGTWHGYYEHDQRWYSTDRFPITATLIQSGRAFHGTMVDAVTDMEQLYRDLREAARDRWSEIQLQRAGQILDRFPGFRIESTLPRESSVDGRFSGRIVDFTKSYRGVYTIHGVPGDGRRLTLLSRDDHRVEYRGVLSPDNEQIEGHWKIPKRGFLGRFRPTRDRGTFILIRKG